MKHYGDITKIKGAEVEAVDIITGGSPCQDLSVAGKRAGLAGERSGLFMEQIRLIKEIRNECIRKISMQGSDVDIRLIKPRFMVWENVCGALSSNSGEDFRAVLEETAKVADENAVIPEPPKGKWSQAGCILGDGWSIAWRVHDAQFWGVPQRRKRIALVADFGGQSAPEILFEHNSVSGNTEPSEQEGQETTRTVGNNLTETGGGCANNGRNRADDSEERNTTSFTLKVRGGAEFDRYGKRAGKGALIQTELSGTLGVSQDQTLITNVQGINGNIAGTLDASYYKGCGERSGVERDVVCVGNGQLAQARLSDTVGTLNCMHDQQAIMVSKCQPSVTYGLDRASFNQGINAQYDFSVEEEKAQTLVSKGPGGVLAQR